MSELNPEFKMLESAKALELLTRFIGSEYRFNDRLDKLRYVEDETGLIDSTHSVEQLLEVFRSSGSYNALRTLTTTKNLVSHRTYSERPRPGQEGTAFNRYHSRYPHMPEFFERRVYIHSYNPENDSFYGSSEYLNRNNGPREPRDILYEVTISPDSIDSSLNGQQTQTFEDTRLVVTRFMVDVWKNMALGMSGA